MKKLSLSLLPIITLTVLIPSGTAFYTPRPAGAQELSPDQTANTQNITPAILPEANPALNIMPQIQRPPLPPPPETPQTAPANLSQNDTAISMPQAWRLKAMMLFKPNNALDKSSIFAMHLQTPYATAFDAITKKFAGSGINLEAVSFSSGHILLSIPNEKGQFDRAIIALRQASSSDNAAQPASYGSLSNDTAGTNIRVFCDSRNRSLTLAQLRTILAQIDGGSEDGQNKPGAESL